MSPDNDTDAEIAAAKRAGDPFESRTFGPLGEKLDVPSYVALEAGAAVRESPGVSTNRPEIDAASVNEPEMDPIAREHFARIRSQVLSGHTLASVPRWLTENTKLKGSPFGFKDHEYQIAILNDQSREMYTRKCAQMGISELSARSTLAFINILDHTTAIYTLPTQDFAKKFATTRFDPIINASSALKRALNANVNNSEVKQFNDSFLYIKGTVGAAAAISVPADMRVHDELDFSDPGVVSNYESRLQHSPYKISRFFSTPTVAGYGVSAGFEMSRRHYYFVKCDHCNHQFLPSYDLHVRIPDFKLDELKLITKENLHHHRWQEAYVECPSCGDKPSLQADRREWVLENPTEHFVAAGYQIQPFDAPNIITCGDIIKASTTYKRRTDFINFVLGLPAEDTEASLAKAELEACFLAGEVPGSYLTTVMGADMGMVCHLWVAAVDHLGEMLTIHTERVPLPRFRERMAHLKTQFRVALTVMDALPYTETLLGLQKSDSNLYGAIYKDTKDLKAFSMKKEGEKKGDEEEDAKAAAQVRQVNINRNFAFDEFMGFVRSGHWRVLKDQNEETIIAHMQDMKRVRVFDKNNELTYVWQKSTKGADHFHHAALYAYIAAQMRGAAQTIIVLPTFVGKFKLKPGR